MSTESEPGISCQNYEIKLDSLPLDLSQSTRGNGEEIKTETKIPLGRPLPPEITQGKQG